MHNVPLTSCINASVYKRALELHQNLVFCSPGYLTTSYFPSISLSFLLEINKLHICIMKYLVELAFCFSMTNLEANQNISNSDHFCSLFP